MRLNHKLPVLFLLGVALLGTGGCSVKMAYNNLDRLMLWQVDEFVDLDAVQKAYLRAEIDTLLRWHRHQHLPMYADYVRELSVSLTDVVSEQTLAEIFETFLGWGEALEARSMPIAIEVLASLSDEQVAGLPEAFAQSNEDLLEEEIEGDLADHQENWAEDFEDALERFTGRLDREQRAYIDRRASAYEPERALWVAYRERWQAELLALLREGRSKPDFAARFTALVDTQESYYGDELNRVFDANFALGREIAAHILSSLNEKQSQRMVERLLELAEDFDELARQKV